ncbi:MAG: dynamin family protein [Actinomycetota bacterium]
MLLDDVRQLLGDLERRATGASQTSISAALIRLDEPLRVAIAGRVKAGKSTLLNAVIGAPIAASDAAECTRYVTWYRYGTHPLAFVVDQRGGRRQVAYRSDGVIEIDGIDASSIERLEVEYPSPTLGSMTLIDTPGIASISESVSERATGFLTPSTGDQGADVLVYALRFMHESDTDFLEAFSDPSARLDDPVGSLGVLSRADELAAGRGDGLGIAALVAHRYRVHRELRRHLGEVMPVSGLLGLHGGALSQRDFEALSALAAMPVHRQEHLLLSVDRFRAQDLPELGSDIRSALIDRFGLAGVRFAIALIRGGVCPTAERLADALVAASGIVPLREVLVGRFADRADALKALRGLDVARAACRSGVGNSDDARRLERIEAGAHELAEIAALRDLGRVRSDDGGRGRASDEELDLVELALGGRGVSAARRLGIEDTRDDWRVVAAERVDWLRSFPARRMLPRPTADVARVALRSLEIAYSAQESS